VVENKTPFLGKERGFFVLWGQKSNNDGGRSELLGDISQA